MDTGGTWRLGSTTEDHNVNREYNSRLSTFQRQL